MTWPALFVPPFNASDLSDLEDALSRCGTLEPLQNLSVHRYLATAGMAYDAALPELRQLSARKKYKARADGRHGGMLDLNPGDSAAFKRWFESRSWAGTHPWEIVFAHPHGIMLWPVLEKDGWKFALGVDTKGLYVAAMRMAIALAKMNIPFIYHDAEKVMLALRGGDTIEVGPFYGQLSLEELEEMRAGADKNVIWSAPNRIEPLRAGGRI